MKVLFGTVLRQTNGFVESLLRLVGFDWTVLDFSTLSRREKTLAVNIPYRGSQGPLHLHCSPTLDRRKLDFPGCLTMTGVNRHRILTPYRRPCLDAAFDARTFSDLLARDRVRSCFRPFRCGQVMPRAGMVMLGSGTRSKLRAHGSLDATGFPAPDLFDHLPIQVIALLAPPTLRTAAVSRPRRSDLGSPLLARVWPRACVPSCWPAR